MRVLYLDKVITVKLNDIYGQYFNQLAPNLGFLLTFSTRRAIDNEGV